jgi:hypothetical protein
MYLNRDHSVPVDLEREFGTVGARSHLKALVAQFAALIQSWPALVEAAGVLDSKGTTMCSRPFE